MIRPSVVTFPFSSTLVPGNKWHTGWHGYLSHALAGDGATTIHIDAATQAVRRTAFTRFISFPFARLVNAVPTEEFARLAQDALDTTAALNDHVTTRLGGCGHC